MQMKLLKEVQLRLILVKRLLLEKVSFLKIPLSQVPQGSYEYVRVSLAYQEYTISIRNAWRDYQGKLASFVGLIIISQHILLGNNSFPVNGNRLAGYWAFALNDFPYATTGQAPVGATTVPNPIASTSPIPVVHCVVTGKFAQN